MVEELGSKIPAGKNEYFSVKVSCLVRRSFGEIYTWPWQLSTEEGVWPQLK